MIKKIVGMLGVTVVAFALLSGRTEAQEDEGGGLGTVGAHDVVRYYHLDALGSVRVVTDEAGQVVERHDYEPFGEECTTGLCADNLGAGAGTPMKFTGKERDAPTGLDYFGARYYASGIGQFTTVDPVYNWRENLVDPQRWNRYAYGRNNPFRYVDPDGKDIFDIAFGTINAFGSNLVLGGGRAEPYNPDFQLGQSLGDVASIGAGLYETIVGGTVAGGGGLLTASVVGSPVGVPATTVAVGVAAHGVGVSASGLIHLSKNSKEGGKLRTKDYNSLDGAEDQAESLRENQRLDRKQGRDRIESTGKSDQAAKHQRDRIKSLEDLPKDE